MNGEVVFPLFGREGWINPTPLRLSTLFYDADTGMFRPKQSRDFDGGWRYWEHYDGDYMTIYNVNLDRRACADLTVQEIENTLLQPETLLDSVKGFVMVENAYYQCKNWLHDHIRALVQRAEIAIIKEIHGDDNPRPHLRSVR